MEPTLPWTLVAEQPTSAERYGKGPAAPGPHDRSGGLHLPSLRAKNRECSQGTMCHVLQTIGVAPTLPTAHVI